MSGAAHAGVNDTLQIDNRMWIVTGVFLGGLNEESVLGLAVAGERFDAHAYGRDLPELFVPEIIVRKAVEAGAMTLHKAPAEPTPDRKENE